MNKINLLQKLAPVGVAAFGAISIIGIVAVPAQAGQLGWDDGTSDFYSDIIAPDGTLTGGDFSVTFSPGAVAAVFSATSEFSDFFSPPELAPVAPITVGFDDFVNLGIVAGIQEFEYDLADDLTFAFTNGVTITLAENSTFLGEIDVTNGTSLGVELEVVEIVGVTVDIPGFPEFSLGDDENPVTGFAFEFEDIPSIGGGEYAGLVSVTPTPEPTTILGLLTIGGLGLGLKRKKQS